MTELEELIQASKELTARLQALQNQRTARAPAEEERDQMEQIVSTAKRHPIQGHVLEKMDDHQRGLYCTALCSIVNKGADLEARTGRLVFIGRLLASCGREALLIEGLTRSLRLDAQFMADFTAQIRDGDREAFAVDAIVLCHLAGEPEDAMLKATAEYISLLELEDEAVGQCARTAAIILSQNGDTFWSVPGADRYMGYMTDWRSCITSDNLFSMQSREGVLVIAGQTFRADPEQVLDLDKFNASHFIFSRCTFLGSTAIRAKYKTADFLDCVFDGDGVDVAAEKEAEGENAGNRNIGRPVLLLSNGSVCRCRFINYTGKTGLPLTNAVVTFTRDGLLEDCEFRSCHLEGIPLVWMGRDGVVRHCSFIQCCYIPPLYQSTIASLPWLRYYSILASSKYEYTYEESAMVSLFHAAITDTHFESCYLSFPASDAPCNIKNSFILSPYKSTDENVTFTDCGPEKDHRGEINIGSELSALR